MAGFIMKRLLFGILTIFVVSVVAFLLVRLMPGSPGAIVLGLGATDAEILAYDTSIGWLDPLPVQYLAWASEAIRGNFGVSSVCSRVHRPRHGWPTDRPVRYLGGRCARAPISR